MGITTILNLYQDNRSKLLHYKLSFPLIATSNTKNNKNQVYFTNLVCRSAPNLLFEDNVFEVKLRAEAVSTRNSCYEKKVTILSNCPRNTLILLMWPLPQKIKSKLFASFTSMVTVSLAKPAESSTLLTLSTKISANTRLVVSDNKDLANTIQLLGPVISEVSVIFHTRQTRI